MNPQSRPCTSLTHKKKTHTEATVGGGGEQTHRFQSTLTSACRDTSWTRVDLPSCRRGVDQLHRSESPTRASQSRDKTVAHVSPLPLASTSKCEQILDQICVWVRAALLDSEVAKD